MNILIAEDDAISRRRLKHFLEKWEYTVQEASDGLDALEKFLSGGYDLIISDWMMPEMDGIELVSNIRSQGQDKPFVYTILLTSRGDKDDVVKALADVGVDDYIVKPFEPDELRARVGVGVRTVKLERTLREYGQGLEKIVRKQTRKIRQTQEETIIRLLTALESRDEETGGHVRRIGLFSAHLAQAAGWTRERVDDIRLAAPMHDIGKIGVPDAILQKNGKLTVDEFEIIKSHTTIGGQILGDSEYPMLQMAHDIAMYHHERWEGGGYPTDILGDDIPDVARIVALVDVYDALSQDRVYRKASPEEEVLELMKSGRGNHFDPFFFDLFLDSIPEFRRIAKDNP